MDREDTKSRSAPAGGSGGGTHDRWTEEVVMGVRR
jgi:hypothetical protein